MTSDLWLWLFYPESISVLSSQISLFTHAGVVLGSERRGVALRPDNNDVKIIKNWMKSQPHLPEVMGESMPFIVPKEKYNLMRLL
jgi:hypothetical protein